MKTKEFDVCIIGSGAGASPVAYTLASAGLRVGILEKGNWYKEKDFFKDEQAKRRKIFRSKLAEEPHVLETPEDGGGWDSYQTAQFWGGNIVGGATNFMSGYFHRLKPQDFRLLTQYGPIEGATITDWPISYDDLEPYYALAERILGVSGKVVQHPYLEPRSTEDFPQPPTLEHPIAEMFDATCKRLNLNPLPMARGILSRPMGDRKSCEYSGYCGSYGCSTGAKASARAALLDQVVGGAHCELITQAKAYHLQTDPTGRVDSVHYFDALGQSKEIKAKIYVVACYAIESARLLLSSRTKTHPWGIGNRYQQVGKHLHCCAGGTGHGVFELKKLPRKVAEQLKVRGPFFNRALQDWYEIDDKTVTKQPIKGGTLDFVFDPPSLAAEVGSLRWSNGELIWGTQLKQKIKRHFTASKDFKFEVFCDWLTHDECYVSLDPKVKDQWGQSVAKVRAGYHPHDVKVAQYLVDRGVEVMKAMGADSAWGNVYTSPTSNLVAGGCRFGTDPKVSVLDLNCRVHDCENLYVTDGSFMPNGGSVTPTLTIYANAFRVADKIKAELLNVTS